MKNMKIRSKLSMGFAVVFVFTLILSLIGIIGIRSVNENYIHSFSYPTQRYNILNQISIRLLDSGRLINSVIVHNGNPDIIDVLAAGLNDNHVRLMEYNEAFRQNVMADYSLTDDERNHLIQLVNEAVDFVNLYRAVINDPIIAAARVSDMDTIMGILATEQQPLWIMNFIRHTAMVAEAEETLAAIREQAENTTSNVTWMLIGIAVVMVIVGVIAAALAISMVTKPMGRLTRIAKDVSKGKDVNIDRANASKDEMGALTLDIAELVDTINGITGDITKFAHEININGDIDYRMDASQYHGKYKEMITALNDFTDSFANDVLDVIGVLENVNKGNFSSELSQMPGKKAVMNKAVDELMDNLGAVSSEINAMIDAAASKGNLKFQIDVNKYDGDWHNIMDGLNHIAKAVDAPLSEITDVMGSLSKGGFSKKITGNYLGDFAAIGNAVNDTIDAISGYLAEVKNVLVAIADGDLTRAVDSAIAARFSERNFAEITDSINNISSTLNKTMSEINSVSAQVLSGAKQISSSSFDLANGASAQAGSVEELNATVDLINQQTLQNADNASQANALSQTSTDNAKEGNNAMQQTLGAMSQIKDSSNNISKIIRTIQDIAFQTNLLALNAAVEAARAGEHGKGFAVVAEEVRSLAARSQTAASETTELISHSINSVETGSGIAQTTADALNTIVDNANKVLGIVSEISAASQGQASAIAQVVEGLQQISQVVQSNSAVSEETAAASEELTSQAELLQQLVAYFKL